MKKIVVFAAGDVLDVADGRSMASLLLLLLL
jgi:hypothetical protein